MSSDVSIKNIRFTYHGFNPEESNPLVKLNTRVKMTLDIDLSVDSQDEGIKELKEAYHSSNEEFYAALIKANRTLHTFFAVFIATRNRWQDLFIPVSISISNLVIPNPSTCDKIIIVALISFSFLLIDLPTMIFRLITFLPRYLYNKTHSENLQISKNLEHAGILKELMPAAIVIQTNYDRLNTKSIDFSLSPVPLCESNEEKNMPVEKYFHGVNGKEIND